MTGRPSVFALAALISLGCGDTQSDTEASGRADGAAAATQSAPPALASLEPVPDRFQIGRAPTREEVIALDIDVMPDGTGLPPGSGTVMAGAAVYAAKCRACHGPEGEGVKELGSRLVGRQPGDAFDFAASMEKERAKTIGNYWPYATTLFDYTRRAMPFDRPGTLGDAEVYAVVAWLLWKNGIVPESAVMDATTLPVVQMPARDRFVLDNRETSTRVR